MIPAREALQRLIDGNRRFIAGTPEPHPAPLAELALEQHPFAIVLGCSDSRVPAEIVFDQGLGDLFVIRVAGNIVAPSQIASIEFAAGRFGTQLVVVLGHTGCGAVIATLEQQRLPEAERQANLRPITRWISPALSGLDQDDYPDADALLSAAVRANIRASAEQLRTESGVLDELIRRQGLLVIGAEYCLCSGRVDFFDGVPQPG